jgi:tetratricopeptide (TPR) repeat protein
VLIGKRKRVERRPAGSRKYLGRRGEHAALASYVGFLNGTVSNASRNMKLAQRERLSGYMRSGLEAVENEELEKAIEIFDRVLRLKPGCSQAWNNKGVCYLRMGKMRAAERCFNKSIRIDPDYRLAWINKHFVEFQMQVDKEPPEEALVKLALL